MPVYGISGSVPEPMTVFIYDNTTGDLLKRKNIPQAGTFSEFISHDPQQVTLVGKPTTPDRQATVFNNVTTVSGITYDSDLWFELSDTTVYWYAGGPTGIVYGDKMYTLSGANWYSWDLLNSTPTLLAALPATYPNRAGYRLAVYNGKIYIYGGWTPSGGYYFTDLYAYDVANNTWATLNNGGSYRKEHGMVVCNDNIYIWGGSPSSHVPLNTVYRYNITNSAWYQLPNCPVAKSKIGYAVDAGNEIIYMNGQSDHYKYDIASGNWTQLASSINKSDHTLVYYNGKIYLYGGISLYEYNILNNTWNQKANSISSNSYHSSFIYNSKMLVWAGDLWEYLI